MKECYGCKAILPLDNFYRRNEGSGRASRCKDCMREKYRDRRKTYQNKWGEKRNKEIRDAVAQRLSSGCVDCGEKNILTLEFDHKEKKEKREYSVAKLMNKQASVERITEEMDKCDVRCANCHRIKTSYDTWNSWRLNYLPK